MKNPQLVTFLAGVALLGACSIDNTPDPTNPMGSAGSGGSATGTGGTAAPATGGSGQTNTAGTTSSAGTSTGTSGSTATGGTGGGSGPSGGSGGTASGGGSGGSAPIGGTGATKWIGTWAASPYTAPSDAQPPAALANSVLRQVVHISVGGSQFRVQFSNITGGSPVTIKSAHVALCKAMPLVDSTIDVATDKALAFGGMAGVTIAGGMEVWSDPVSFTVPALGNVSITTALGTVDSNITAHAGARTTSYVVANSTDVSVAAMASAPKGDHWYYISGIDVMADATSGGAVAAIGDSITDGRGTDTNGNNRWTDILAARLQMNPATANIGVLNQGIGATNLSGGGTAAEARFKRDVLGQSGIKYAIIYDGVNDIGGGAAFNAMKATYDKLIAAGRAANIKVYGATIPPFGSNSYYSAAHEMVRKQVNDYVKMAGTFDGVIDFDMALTDGGSPPNLQAAFAEWSQKDGLHPGPAGYKKMGETPDLMLFTK